MSCRLFAVSPDHPIAEGTIEEHVAGHEGVVWHLPEHPPGGVDLFNAGAVDLHRGLARWGLF
jgi:hypothetical protein